MKRSIIHLMVFCVMLSAALPASGDGIDEEISRLRKIVEEKGYSFTVGRTPLTGLSGEELRARTGFVPPSKEAWDALPKFSPPPVNLSGADITDPVFDWRALGAVTAIRDQLLCGSCWAFAAIAELESQILIYDGVMMDLSEQQMIDCNMQEKDCDGGNAWAAYEVLQNAGAVTESCIPYTQSDGNICTQESCTRVAYIDGWATIQNNVTAIKTALLSGPVYTAFRTSGLFNSYTGGCF
ncbi:MAG TPA: C1 family peptidase, partial [Candidatus Krumholzibacterium sp.]|nr:C1 family peptidase [Candidatus Krumholzibacterium sp.]